MRSDVGRRGLLHGAAVAAVAWALRSPAFAQAPEGARTAIAPAPTAWLAALPAEGRRRGSFAFGDTQRFDWGYVPRRREGLAFKDMPAPARVAVHELMNASLSAVGYNKAVYRHAARARAAADRDVRRAAPRSRQLRDHG